MNDVEDRVMKTYWPPSRPWRYSLDFHRRPVANWGVTFYEGSEPVSEQRWDAQPKEVTTAALLEWLEPLTGHDAARDLVVAVFISRPFFFVDQQRRSSGSR
ncbi:MAG: hypothetical protein WCB51_03355 [Candidatus Dormiibacterota bacterium]